MKRFVLNVFSNAVSTLALTLGVVILCQVAVAGDDLNHIGCFKEDRIRKIKGNSEHPYGFGVIAISDMTIEKCIAHCKSKGNMFAGVQDRKYCRCNNRYGEQGKTRKCRRKCPGNKKQVCGHRNAANWYATGRVIRTGFPCVDVSLCEHKHCSNGKCAKLPDGNACTSHHSCKINHCHEGKCKPKLKDGVACTSHYSCANNFCYDGKCLACGKKKYKVQGADVYCLRGKGPYKWKTPRGKPIEGKDR